MLVLELGLLFLLSLLHTAVSTCQKWDPSSQSKDQSLFLFFASGRFSARLSPYVIFLILREKHGLNVMVDRECLDSVTKYFDIPPTSQLPAVDEVFCPDDLERMKRHMIEYTNKGPNLLEDHFIDFQSKGIVVHMWPEGPPSKSTYWVPEDLMNQHASFIRSHLVFKSEYQNFADNILQQIAASDRSGAELVFVGIHVRRTDYVQFSKVYLNKKVVGKTYFLEAIEYFQESYPDNQVYFIAVSDDLVWVKKNLGSIKGVVVAGVGGGEEDGLPSGLDPVGVDLAILSSCNHTIMSQGQFGLWASFLAEGDVYSQYGPLIRSTLV